MSEKVAKGWAEERVEWGEEVDWQRLMPQRNVEVLPRRRVVERTFSRLSQYRRVSKDHERLCATGDTLIHVVAMTRLTVRQRALA